MVLFTACSSTKAVQTNAAVASEETSSGIVSASSNTSSVTSSDLVSHSAPSVSSAVVTSSKPMTGGNSTSHQAPVSQKPSTGTTKPASAAPKPASTKPASTKPASVAPKPASRPVSTKPVSKPASTAPVSQGIKAKYHGATYGCDDKSQYDYVMKKAEAVKGSDRYSSALATEKEAKDSFEEIEGVSYTETWADIFAIQSYFGTAGTGSASVGSAYDYYTGANSMCGDKAKALEAALHVNGYNARLAKGGNHMWVQVNVGGTWYNLYRGAHSSVPAGLTLSSTGYNL